MIPTEVHEEHMAVCKNCKEREAVRRMVDFHVDWIDCFWDCPNDYEHWIADQQCVEEEEWLDWREEQEFSDRWDTMERSE